MGLTLRVGGASACDYYSLSLWVDYLYLLQGYQVATNFCRQVHVDVKEHINSLLLF